MKLSEATWSAWAKSDRDGGRLSLVRHCADAMAVAGLVWDRWLPRRTREAMSVGLPGGVADGRVLFVWLAAVHDVGKLTPAFACQVPVLAEAMHDKGLRMGGALANRRALPHGLASGVELQRFLCEQGWKKSVALTYAVVVDGHHGKPSSRGDVGQARFQADLLGAGEWKRCRDELLTHFTCVSGAQERLEAWREVPLSVPVQALLTAAVIVADWVASNQDLFPLNQNRTSSTEAVEAWEALGLPSAWVPVLDRSADGGDGEGLFRSRFDLPGEARMRPLQAGCVAAAWEVPEPGVMVVEAAMGEGKTEAALLAAEILAFRFGLGGVFVALPTMATSDAMFGRVRRWVGRLPGEVGSMFLAHGKAALNPEFAELKRAGFASIGIDCDDSGVIAHSWFVGKKGPLANVVVGTIDQVLRGALKTRHLMLRHLGLANKVVIVDEVHAADSYMSTYLCRCLEWLGAYGVPVILLSATLPSAQRRSLLAAYRRGRSGATETEPIDTATGYPRLTVWPAPEAMPEIASSGRESVAVSIERLDDDVAVVVSAVKAALADGGVVGIVCNTVGCAQEMFEALRTSGVVNRDELLLVHSRFVATHRTELEDDLRRLLGPPTSAGSVRPGRFVLVGTQVIEQSLDIDVDLLITDLAPIDLMLQRIGRLHRHQRADRPHRVAQPRCLVRGADWSQLPPNPDRGSVAVYQKARLLRAAAVLDQRAELRIPEDVPELVETAYAEPFSPPSGWEVSLAEADAQWEAFRAEQRHRAGAYLVRSPHSEMPTLHGWVTTDLPDDDDRVGGQAQVRDAEDSIEAIVVRRKGSEVRVLDVVKDYADRGIPTEGPPEPELAKAVAACTIRLPATLTRYGGMGRVITALEDTWYPGWQQSHWLAGELVLELDENLSTELAGYRLRYDDTLGLLVHRSGESK
ncbi:CRISPR-associated helicase Cas3' [Nocardia sp. NPDC004068]|uniref:CRISPR-associated helicase Cas3' n=1 Tax=Nocardia sp. NPDC004068 TaxID=3364303 RepID=UPI0036793F66